MREHRYDLLVTAHLVPNLRSPKYLSATSISSIPTTLSTLSDRLKMRDWLMLPPLPLAPQRSPLVQRPRPSRVHPSHNYYLPHNTPNLPLSSSHTNAQHIPPHTCPNPLPPSPPRLDFYQTRGSLDARPFSLREFVLFSLPHVSRRPRRNKRQHLGPHFPQWLEQPTYYSHTIKNKKSYHYHCYSVFRLSQHKQYQEFLLSSLVTNQTGRRDQQMGIQWPCRPRRC